MASKLTQNWIPIERVESLVQLEPALFILLFGITAFIVYKLFLSALTPERHRNLRGQFRNVFYHSLFGIKLFIAYWLLREFVPEFTALSRLTPYVGLVAIISGSIVFVKSCRIFSFQYLFFTNMQVGVPLLLVNLFSLLLSLLIGAWLLATVFEFRLLPLAATSAAFSIVLGLALQDTLGNLFAGIALQLDKPFAIGDWIEVTNGTQKLVGLVTEITWRATILVAVTEEIITIPNRTLAQSEVANFCAKTGPIIRSQVFRIPYGMPVKEAKAALLRAAEQTTEIRRHPEPIVFLTESTESWISMKLIYYLDDYGRQFMITDKVLTRALDELATAGIPIASQRVSIKHLDCEEKKGTS